MKIKVIIPGVCEEVYNLKKDIVNIRDTTDIHDGRQDLFCLYRLCRSKLSKPELFIKKDFILYSIKGYTYIKKDKKWIRGDVNEKK